MNNTCTLFMRSSSTPIGAFEVVAEATLQTITVHRTRSIQFLTNLHSPLQAVFSSEKIAVQSQKCNLYRTTMRQNRACEIRNKYGCISFLLQTKSVFGQHTIFAMSNFIPLHNMGYNYYL